MRQPPAILQIHREIVKPGLEAEFRRVERDIARACTTLGGPHPYLGLESLTGAKEIWFFNGYASENERQQAVDGYANNSALMTALGKLGREKANLIDTPVEVFAEHRPGLSRGAPWTLGQGRFLAISIGTGESRAGGTVFETADGIRFGIAAFRTRSEAKMRRQAPNLAPTCSRSAPSGACLTHAWIAGDPDFWRPIVNS